MTLVSNQRFTLNPNATPFVPMAAYNQVEDFSPVWWDLVKNSAWFREYWLSMHGDGDVFCDADDECFESIESILCQQHDDDGEINRGSSSLDEKYYKGIEVGVGKDVMKVLKVQEKQKIKAAVERPKYPEKPPQRLGPKCVTKRIHQPR